MKKKRKMTISQAIMEETEENLKEKQHNLTRKTYTRNTRNFIKFCREKYNCKTLTECTMHIQDYSNFLQKKELTPSTIHTYIASVCAATKVPMSTIKKPIRHTSNFSRGRLNESNYLSRDFNDIKWSHIVEFQKRVGLRRAELKKLTGKDFVQDESNNWCVRTKGKGGKLQLQLIEDKDVDFIKSYFECKHPEQFIFDNLEFKNNLNFHYFRAENAKGYYINTLENLRENPENIKKLIEQIKARWNVYNLDENGNPKRFDYKRIQGNYYLRGKNKQAAIKNGGSVKFNKLAVLATSVFKLSHWRLDVTVNNYLAIQNGGIKI